MQTGFCVFWSKLDKGLKKRVPVAMNRDLKRGPNN